jgi:hypothetical protein
MKRTIEDMHNQYVVWTNNGFRREYVRELNPDGSPRYFTTCQHCALRMTRKVAHAAHLGKSSFRVLRLSSKS